MKRGLIVATIVMAIGIILVPVWRTKQQSLLVEQQSSTAEKLSKKFKTEKNAPEQEKILIQLLKMNSAAGDCVFYELLTAAQDLEIPIFNQALQEAGTGATIINLGRYVKSLIGPNITEAQNYPKNLIEDPIEKERVGQRLKQIDDRLTKGCRDAVIKISRRDSQQFIDALKTEWSKKPNQERNEMIIFSSAVGLGILGEEGFELALKSAKTENDKLMLVFLTETFGPYAVVPILKMYENPDSNKYQRDLAGILVQFFPKTEPVFEQIVEAYKHGRYYELNVGTKKADGTTEIGLADMLSAAMTNWRSGLEEAFKNHEPFIIYVAENHLLNPDGQNHIINLLRGVDPELKISLPYFEQLNFNGLSDDSLKTMDTIFYEIGSIGINGSIDSPEKFALFCKLFSKLDQDRREKQQLIYKLIYFIPNAQKKFVLTYFKDMTNDEKISVICLLGRNLDLDPIEVKQIFAEIITDCNEDQKNMIQYQLNK